MEPFVTICVPTLNRAWILPYSLKSLLAQDYPKDRLHFLIVDGGSKDGTPELAERLLREAGVSYEVLVEPCNLPQARNIALMKMKGDYLLFADSDVVAPPNALRSLVSCMENGVADVVVAGMDYITIRDIRDLGELDKALAAYRSEHKCESLPYVKSALGGFFVLSEKVVKAGLRFDPDISFIDDIQFGFLLWNAGYKVAKLEGLRVLDVNWLRAYYSDIYRDQPLAMYLRGFRKKAFYTAYGLSGTSVATSVLNLISVYGWRRVLWHVTHLPSLLIGIAALYLAPQLWPLPISYFLLTALAYLAKGLLNKRGVKALRDYGRFALVGLPFYALVLYYLIKHRRAFAELASKIEALNGNAQRA